MRKNLTTTSFLLSITGRHNVKTLGTKRSRTREVRSGMIGDINRILEVSLELRELRNDLDVLLWKYKQGFYSFLYKQWWEHASCYDLHNHWKHLEEKYNHWKHLEDEELESKYQGLHNMFLTSILKSSSDDKQFEWIRSIKNEIWMILCDIIWKIKNQESNIWADSVGEIEPQEHLWKAYELFLKNILGDFKNSGILMSQKYYVFDSDSSGEIIVLDLEECKVLSFSELDEEARDSISKSSDESLKVLEEYKYDMYIQSLLAGIKSNTIDSGDTSELSSKIIEIIKYFEKVDNGETSSLVLDNSLQWITIYRKLLKIVPKIFDNKKSEYVTQRVYSLRDLFIRKTVHFLLDKLKADTKKWNLSIEEDILSTLRNILCKSPNPPFMVCFHSCLTASDIINEWYRDLLLRYAFRYFNEYKHYFYANVGLKWNDNSKKVTKSNEITRRISTITGIVRCMELLWHNVDQYINIIKFFQSYVLVQSDKYAWTFAYCLNKDELDSFFESIS